MIIEYGFLDSTGDDVNQLKNNYIKFADAVVTAVSNYIDLPYELGNVYIVKKGDTLYKIANNYNISVSELKKINNLTSDTLSIGDQLLVPIIEESDYTIYIVKKGDSLYSIAQKYNTTVDELKRKNNLNSNLLSIGQILII